MATTKKSTTAKKATSTSSAPKKPRSPKPVVEKVAEPIENTEPVEEAPVKVAVKKSGNEKVRVFIPLDPSETLREQFVHGSVNGKFYRLGEFPALYQCVQVAAANPGDPGYFWQFEDCIHWRISLVVNDRHRLLPDITSEDFTSGNGLFPEGVEVIRPRLHHLAALR